MQDYRTRHSLLAARYRVAYAQYKRARTIHEREQEGGKTDMSVMQTRRMYLAVQALQRAARRYADAQRSLFGN